MKELARFPGAEIVWCQEEPQNMGAWWFVMPRIEQTLRRVGHKCQRVRYVGRPESASTAVGLLRAHRQEQDRIVREALGIRDGAPEA
jgi:2-oxoglutarate dehydrogenase E1 component